MSLRAAINAKCRECIYDPHSGAGNWRQQVTACTSYKCPLYPVRPTSAGKTAKSGPDVKGGQYIEALADLAEREPDRFDPLAEPQRSIAGGEVQP